MDLVAFVETSFVQLKQLRLKKGLSHEIFQKNSEKNLQNEAQLKDTAGFLIF